MIIFIVLKGAAAGIIIIGIHQHAWSALCNKHMNTKNETKYMAQGRINTKSGHNNFYLVFPFLLSVLKYGTEIFFFDPPLFSAVLRTFSRFANASTRVRFVRAYALFLKQLGCLALTHGVLMAKIIAKHETNDFVISSQGVCLFPPLD